MASQINKPEGPEAKKTEPKAKPNRTIKNPLIYAGTVVLLVITIVAFVFIPSIGGGVSSGSNPTFGSWNGKAISYTADSYFANQVAQINEYLRQQGLSEQNFQLYAYQVWRIAFQSAAIRTALIDTVTKTGFRVSEKGLDEAIMEDATFQENGKFSLEKYNKTSKATLLSIRSSTKEDLIVRRYYEDLYSIAPSTAEIAFVASMAKPQRTISYTSIPLADYPESEIIDWGKKNSDLFRTIGISRITITSSEADAKKILQQVRDNKLSFEDAAKSHSKDAYADKGGDAGTIYYYTFTNDFSNKDDAQKVVSLAKGDVSDVYKLGDKAWAFFKINSAIAAPDFAKPATTAEVKAYLYEKERGTLETWAIAKANSLVSSTQDGAFQAAARKAGLSVNSAGPFIINLGNPTFYAYNQQIPLLMPPWTNTDAALKGAEEDEAFMTELFSLPKGKVSKPMVVGDNVVLFSVSGDTTVSDDDVAMVKFAYPYFHQQTVDTQTRNTFLKSKKFKDEFNTAFLKIFNTQAASSSKTTTTVAPPSAK